MKLAHDYVDQNSATVLLLHSSVCDRRMWDPQWQALQEAGFSVLRCDFPGHGDTPVPGIDFNPADLVLELVDELGIESLHLVGASFGGRVSLEIAARRPGLVERLVLICAAAKLIPPTEALEAYGTREDELVEAGELEAAVELTLDTFLGPLATPETRLAVGDMQRHAYEVQIAAADVRLLSAEHDPADVTARTLVISGAKDVDFFRVTAGLLAEAIPDAELVELPWAGHLPSLESPQELNPVLLRHLS